MVSYPGHLLGVLFQAGDALGPIPVRLPSLHHSNTGYFLLPLYTHLMPFSTLTLCPGKLNWYEPYQWVPGVLQLQSRGFTGRLKGGKRMKSGYLLHRLIPCFDLRLTLSLYQRSLLPSKLPLTQLLPSRFW